MNEVISSDVLEWARDLAVIKQMLAAEAFATRPPSSACSGRSNVVALKPKRR